MFNWEDLRHFGALAGNGTLSAAARQLGVEHATVARRVASLEAALDMKLVDRRGRRLSLTEDGFAIAELARAVDNSALAVARAATGARATVRGELTISAPPTLASVVLADPIAVLRQRYPGIGVTLLGETRRSSLERLEADIAIRLGRPEAGELTISKLGEIGFGLYARPDYLAETESADRVFIGYDGDLDQSPQNLALRDYAGARVIALRASTLESQLALVKAGAGIAMLPHFLAAPATLALVADGPIVEREVWLAIHSDLRGSAIVQAASPLLRESVKQALRDLQ